MTFMMSQYVGIPFQQRSYHVISVDVISLPSISGSVRCLVVRK